MSRKTPPRCRASVETLEERLCLANSVGWDGPGPGSASLTYYIGNVPSYLGSAAEAAIETALSAWASVAKIRFTQTTRPGLSDSIDFTFGRIDGRNGVLAQAYYPDDVNPSGIAGDIKFDSSERWEIGNRQGSGAFDLVLTAVHEIGHSLGLNHSGAVGSTMSASISPRQSFSGLSASDVRAIRQLYAPSGSASPTGAVRARFGAAAARNTAIGVVPLTDLVPPFRSPRFWRLRGGAAGQQTETA